MSNVHSTRPESSEFNAYYQRYVDAVPDGNLMDILKRQHDEVLARIDRLSEEQAAYRYAHGKWTVKEVFGHMIDTEWIFCYRALRFARTDTTPLPGMDQDHFMSGANFGDRHLSDMGREFAGLRTAAIHLVGSFSDTIMSRTGTASGYPFTVRALCWIIAGHCQHHLDILTERYSV